MNRPYVVAVTGGIGSGKTTVCDAFARRYGVPVIDADIARINACGRTSPHLDIPVDIEDTHPRNHGDFRHETAPLDEKDGYRDQKNPRLPRARPTPESVIRETHRTSLLSASDVHHRALRAARRPVFLDGSGSGSSEITALTTLGLVRSSSSVIGQARVAISTPGMLKAA